METGQVLHIIVTVAALLGAAAVALVCDMLKTNNERLRQINMELRIRREEEQRRTEMALEQLRRIPAVTANSPIPSPLAPALTESVRHRFSEEQTREISRAGDTQGTRAFARDLLATTADQSETVEVSKAMGAGELRRRNWDELLHSARPRDVKHRGELIPFESLHNSQEVLHLPPGFHTSGGLDYLLESRSPFRGTVVAIGVNGLDETRHAEDSELRAVVTDYLRSLLEPGEFACQPSIDRYVIVSRERDAAAVRRFNELAGKLCDSELRRPSTNCALFSCGGFEASGEPLCDAVDIAGERMRDARNRQTAPMLETARRRKVV
jgi:hypothetical protein